MATSASRMEAPPQRPALRGASLLSFGAAPAFAVMAVLTGLPGDAMPVTCLGGAGGSFLAGMTWMYVLMSVFHLPPWLKLVAARGAARAA